MLNQKISISALFITAALAFSGTAAAYDAQEMERAAKQFDLISPEEVRDIAVKEQQGYVSEVDLDNRDYGQGYVYEVEVDKEDGSEWEFDIDAKTGEILHMKRDD